MEGMPRGYRALAELGRGGVGVVWSAEAPDGRRVAVKVAHASAQPWRYDWLRREASLAARLRHPHVVELITSGELDDGRPFLVFDHVDGVSLEACADALDAPSILRLGRELLDALAYAHDAGVLHLDVSPSNVLVRASDGAALLTDFGLATPRDHRAGLPVLVAGTPGYLSPEQALGCGIGERSDLYGLGAVLYRLLAGHPPHGGADSTEVLRRTLYGEVLPLRPRVPGVPDGVLRLVEGLVARDPERRPASAAAARATWLASEGGPKSPPEAFAPTPLVAARRDSVLATLAVPAGPTAPRRAPSGSPPSRDDVTEWLDAPAPTRSGERAVDDVADEEQRDVAEALAARLALPPRGVAGGSGARMPGADDGSRGRVLLHAEGAPHSGRTTVLDALVRSLHRRDVRVVRVIGRRGLPSPPLEVLSALVVRWLDAEVGPPFAVAQRVAAALDERLANRVPPEVLRTARDALVDGVLARAAASRVGHAGPHLVRALSALAADERPTVLVVDDADSIDRASLDALTNAELRVLMVTEPGLRFGDAWERVALTSAHLPPTRRPPPTPDALDEDSRALLRAAATFEGDAPRRALAPLASAVLGRPVEVELVERLVARGLLRAVDGSVARAERWVRTRASLDPRDDSLAGHAAVWLGRECFDPSPGVRAAMARLAERAGDLRLAAFAYAEAGRRAAAIHHPDAATHLARALALAPPTADDDVPPRGAKAPTDAVLDHETIEIELARLRLDAGHVDEAAALALRAAERADAHDRPVLAARARRIAATARAAAGHVREGVALLEAGLATLGEGGDPTERALTLASLGWQLGYVLGRNEEGIALGRRALVEAARIDAPALQASLCGRLGANLLRAGDWDGQLGINLRDLGLSLLAGDPFGVARAHVNIGVCYTNRGLLALARAHTEAALELAEEHGAALAALIATNNLALLACDEGDLERALALAEDALARARARGAAPSAETWATLVRVHAGRGDRAAAAQALDAMRAVASEAERPLVARIAALLATPEEACASLEEALASDVADPYDRATTRLALAVARRRAGRPDVALEREARATLESLGADVNVELRRVGG